MCACMHACVCVCAWVCVCGGGGHLPLNVQLHVNVCTVQGICN